MDREQIENAGRDYALDQLGIVGLPGRAEAMKAFVAGVDWRINSVWHDANEKPDKNQFVLFECRKTYGKGYSVNFWENYPLLKNVLLGWAYIKDLLPERKEETV